MLDRLYLLAYLRGYAGRTFPRPIRRLVAGSALHRAWLLGHLGFFEQEGTRYGPAHPYEIPAVSSS
ncbi:hypothetical protein SAMN04488117_1327 [Celeribacter baekdonensis]|uniref:Uncharacterized protein n=1 Tax=Celeribacter baekdonensis TaxID=875171 RepID=A0A1G7V0V8_9RHOB|nr:hypothetical protein [Celeribacter baekdonensis]SDG53131.1 hypothetical protein SAMN04488117_1327 [Celeribacter baekdonensis]